MVDIIAGNCFHLEVLNIAGLAFVDDLLLVQLSENCPQLNHINLKGCRSVSNSRSVVPHALVCVCLQHKEQDNCCVQESLM